MARKKAISDISKIPGMIGITQYFSLPAGPLAAITRLT